MNKSFRIKTTPGGNDTFIPIRLEQEYEMLEVLSLKLNQEDAYKIYSSDYGVLVGRVIANDGFGVPNAKVSIFIKSDLIDDEYFNKRYLYPYTNLSIKNDDGVRYNLLPDSSSENCHQTVGTFPNKRFMLDNNLLLEIFEDYYKFTTVTNEAGDYMLFGVPTGSQTVHVDIDLSDIGVLSQKPRDMIFKGYTAKQFESPNMFKKSTNLDSLPQIYSQNATTYIYPFWGDRDEGEVAISRSDINIQYKFEPTCVFIGGAFTDSVESAVSKNCKPYKHSGKMDKLISGEGTIEMVRETIDGTSVEYVQLEGNRLINGDGVWAYQIPMNLDYMVTDEFGNMVVSDNPNKGIPTKTNVRFRVSLDNVGDASFSKRRASYLIPNNPKEEKNESYDFLNINPSKEEHKDNLKTLYWNKVYSVKSYIPRIQIGSRNRTRSFTGIKTTNSYGHNNPFPYNKLFLRLPIVFVLICAIATFIVELANLYNNLISGICDFLVTRPLCKLFKFKCIKIGRGWCEHSAKQFAPGCKSKRARKNTGDVDQSREKIIRCVVNQLANEYGVINFDFYNDWINGSLYLPLFQYKIKKKKKRRFFGLLGSKVVGEVTTFCGRSVEGDNKNDKIGGFFRRYKTIKVVDACSLNYNNNGNYEGRPQVNKFGDNKRCKKEACYEESSSFGLSSGIVREFSENNIITYYYVPRIWGTENRTPSTHMFATDIILLGGMNDCDVDGIPPLHQLLPSTSFNMPPDLVVTEGEDVDDVDIDPNEDAIEAGLTTESSGVDWGIRGEDQTQFGPKGSKKGGPGGLFVGTECFDTYSFEKTCINAERICEIGVGIDERYVKYRNCDPTHYVPNGFITHDELLDSEVRQMFSTLNINQLKTIDDGNGFTKYEFIYNYPENFDGKLQNYKHGNSELRDVGYQKSKTYEKFDYYYYDFRFGNINGESSSDLLKRQFYKEDKKNFQFPKYENSFYFYFGLNTGKTAIEEFNNNFYTPCIEDDKEDFTVIINKINDYLVCPCSSNDNNKPLVEITVLEAEIPLTVTVINDSTGDSVKVENLNENIFKIGDGEVINIDLVASTYTLTIIDDTGKEVVKSFTINEIGGVMFSTRVEQTDVPIIDKDNTTCGLINIPEDYKGIVTLYNYNEDVLNKKGCSLSGYRLIVEDMYRVYKSNGILYSGSVIDGEIYLCPGAYTLRVQSNKCPDEDYYETEVVINKPEELEMYVNGVNVNRFINKQMTVGDWLTLYNDLYENPNDKSSLIKYEGVNLDEENEPNFIFNLNKAILEMFVIRCIHEHFLTITKFGGIEPVIKYLRGVRNEYEEEDEHGNLIKTGIVNPSNYQDLVDDNGNEIYTEMVLSAVDEIVALEGLYVNVPNEDDEVGLVASVVNTFTDGYDDGGYFTYIRDDNGTGLRLPLDPSGFKLQLLHKHVKHIPSRMIIHPTIETYNWTTDAYQKGPGDFIEHEVDPEWVLVDEKCVNGSWQKEYEDMNPSSPTYGNTKIEIGGPCDDNQNWVSLGDGRCEDGVWVETFEDMNPNSPTYGNTKIEIGEPCDDNQNWVSLGDGRCEDGVWVETFEDMNPNSPTYGEIEIRENENDIRCNGPDFVVSVTNTYVNQLVPKVRVNVKVQTPLLQPDYIGGTYNKIEMKIYSANKSILRGTHTIHNRLTITIPAEGGLQNHSGVEIPYHMIAGEPEIGWYEIWIDGTLRKEPQDLRVDGYLPEKTAPAETSMKIVNNSSEVQSIFLFPDNTTASDIIGQTHQYVSVLYNQGNEYHVPIPTAVNQPGSPGSPTQYQAGQTVSVWFYNTQPSQYYTIGWNKVRDGGTGRMTLTLGSIYTIIG